MTCVKDFKQVSNKITSTVYKIHSCAGAKKARKERRGNRTLGNGGQDEK